LKKYKNTGNNNSSSSSSIYHLLDSRSIFQNQQTKNLKVRKMKRTKEQKERLLKELWNKRNPCHDKDQNGVDRFWGTVLCVFEDYKVALTLPDVVKPFYCHSEDAGGLRCGSQCLGCEGMEKMKKSFYK
jgi:hypothetical protein